MTQTTNYHCNRCGGEIQKKRSVLVADVGPLRERLSNSRVDLCQECAERFLEWLKGSQATGEDLPDTVSGTDIPLGPVGRVARRVASKDPNQGK